MIPCFDSSAEAKVALIFPNGYLHQGSPIHLHWGILLRP
jgi:hypothetical protein